MSQGFLNIWWKSRGRYVLKEQAPPTRLTQIRDVIGWVSRGGCDRAVGVAKGENLENDYFRLTISTMEILKSKDQYQGTVRNVEWKEKSDGEYSVNAGCLAFFFFWNAYTRYETSEILSFRLEQVDNQGNILSYLSVYLKAAEIEGSLVDGDEAKILGYINANKRLIPNEIVNLTTNESIRIVPKSWNRNFKYFAAIKVTVRTIKLFSIALFILFLWSIYLEYSDEISNWMNKINSEDNQDFSN